MKTHDNTLYVTTEGAYLAKEGDQVVVRVDREERLRLPMHTLAGIVCFGPVSVSPFALDLCAKNDVAVTFLTTNGRFMARLVGPVSGNVLLRREQHRRSEDVDKAAEVARAVVLAKIHNSRVVLQRAGRDHDRGDVLSRAVKRLARLLQETRDAAGLDAIRGAEGEAAGVYFSAFNRLITVGGDEFVLKGRTRRPPRDRVNALLSFLYVILAHDVRSACESVGLDPQMGFLHRDRPGRASLALDLMEELRPVLADRLAVSLINRQQVTGGGFTVAETGAVEMDDATRKAVLIAWQKRKAETIQHPFLDETVTIGLIPHVQARLLARHLRGDLDAYPPLFWK